MCPTVEIPSFNRVLRSVVQIDWWLFCPYQGAKVGGIWGGRYVFAFNHTLKGCLIPVVGNQGSFVLWSRGSGNPALVDCYWYKLWDSSSALEWWQLRIGWWLSKFLKRCWQPGPWLQEQKAARRRRREHVCVKSGCGGIFTLVQNAAK